jgi:hypothetical protein
MLRYQLIRVQHSSHSQFERPHTARMRYDLGEGLVSLTIRPTHIQGITPSLDNVRPDPLGVHESIQLLPSTLCTMVGSLAHSYSGSRTLGYHCCSPHSIPLSQCTAPSTAHTTGKQRMHYLWHTSRNASKQHQCSETP